MLLVHILALSLVCNALYSHNMFYYSDAVVVYAQCVLFPCPVYEKAYSCLAVVCLRIPL